MGQSTLLDLSGDQMMPRPNNIARCFASRPCLAPRLRALIASFALVTAAAVTATPASAQFGGRASFGAAFQPDIMQRDVTLMTSSLALEEWQRPVMEALIQDYMSNFNTGVDALKDRMKVASDGAAKVAQSGNGDAVLEKIMQPLNAWRVEKRAMYDKFLADLKSQLGPQQLERWPNFERALRRERLLSDGDLSGESTDLFSVVARMQLTPAEEEAVKQPLETYELMLDEALVNRETKMEQYEPELAEAMRSMNYDAGANTQDKIMALRILVRSANDSGIDLLAAALGDRGGEFRMRALEAGYPDVFRPHPVMILMQQTRALPSITPEQAGQIDELMAEFSTACEDANMKLYDAVREDQPKAPRKRVKAVADRKANGPGSAPNTPQGSNSTDPIVKARVERESMGAPFRQRLMAILTDEQKGEMPGGVKVEPSEERKTDSTGAEGKEKKSGRSMKAETDGGAGLVESNSKRRVGNTKTGAGKDSPQAAPEAKPE